MGMRHRSSTSIRFLLRVALGLVMVFFAHLTDAYATPTFQPPPRRPGFGFFLKSGPLPKVRGTQIGLQKPAQVDHIKAAMKRGSYAFSEPRGKIGGFVDKKGVYHVVEGHHRMAAAMELWKETGDPRHVQSLVQHGRFVPKARPDSSRPLPSRSRWGAFRNALGF